MENKKEINLEDFVSNGWNRVKQLIHAQSLNIQSTEHPADEENEKQLEEGEDQEDNDQEEESKPVDDEVKYTETETNDELDDSQYSEETKLIIEGIGHTYIYFNITFILYTKY